ncbi:MAG TPA: hypothetical protein VHY48_05695 [Acidobacteriaceae bacterium]|jgi:uncharacterized membrane protein|nr:hypothetical protein [Acidobacteriaceae bacterium]
MVSDIGFWPGVAGLVVLVLGVAWAWPRLRAARGIGKFVALALAFEGAPLVAFGVEHMVEGGRMAPMVPSWIPVHVFWIYFVGAALIAAGLSFAAGREVRWAAPLFALMIAIFEATLTLPSLTEVVKDHTGWVLLFREPGFVGGALALASLYWLRQRGVLLTVGRVLVAAAVIVFGVVSLRHPEVVPGIPLEKLMPAWYPGHAWLTPACGVVLLVAGVAMLIPKWAWGGAVAAGAVMVMLTAVFYAPLLPAHGYANLMEAVNYVGDTLLFGATALLVAMAIARDSNQVEREAQ